jgi:hypothetical protein
MVYTMAITIDQIARQYLATKSAVDAATDALKALEVQLKAELVKNHMDKMECDGKTITLIQAERRSFDAAALKSLISASLFRKLTTTEIRTTLVDAAVSLGEVDRDLIDKVTIKTPYTQLKVN